MVGEGGDDGADASGIGRPQRWLLAWKMSTIWIASGKHSSARVQIQGAGRFYAVRLRLDGSAFVGCDHAPQRFGGPLDLLGVEGDPDQVVQQGAGLLL